jgi:hypothetical protein
VMISFMKITMFANLWTTNNIKSSRHKSKNVINHQHCQFFRVVSRCLFEVRAFCGYANGLVIILGHWEWDYGEMKIWLVMRRLCELRLIWLLKLEMRKFFKFDWSKS